MDGKNKTGVRNGSNIISEISVLKEEVYLPLELRIDMIVLFGESEGI